MPQVIMTFTLISTVYACGIAKPGHGECAAWQCNTTGTTLTRVTPLTDLHACVVLTTDHSGKRTLVEGYPLDC